MADRVDLPFVVDNGIQDIHLAVDQFPLRRWAAPWLSWGALEEFAVSGWAGNAAIVKAVGKPDDSRDALDHETRLLVRAALDERPDALGEILAQNDDAIGVLMSLLDITPRSHPATCRLMDMANMVATYAVMHFKREYNRARPSQRTPSLLPPVPVPGHASYPSGHATQSRLAALCVAAVLPVATAASHHTLLLTMADRVARNREIAGLHYASDSNAGKRLADALFPLLDALPNQGKPWSFGATMIAAGKEWLP